MAGSDPNFDPTQFRFFIKQTMKMGIPTATDEKLTWHFKPVQDFTPQDPALKPYDWSTPPESSEPGNPDLPSGVAIVDYALEFSAGTSSEGDVGRFDTSRLKVTLLDVDYEVIKTADYATIGRVYYNIKFVAPPIGMFSVTVYEVHLVARDQA